MTPLNKKLLRDLWRLRGQVLAIALVIGSGVATLVMSISTVDALKATTDAYYQRYQFADVFAYATRAPERLSAELRNIPGVAQVQPRITQYANVDIVGFNEPVVGQVVSAPAQGKASLNQLVLRKGDWLSPNANDEIILNESFAEAHRIAINDTISLTLNGTKRSFRVVGYALSPEFIYSIGPGSLMPDDKRFGVMWLNREALEAAFDLENAFNAVAIKLMLNARLSEVLTAVDNILAPYGGVSAISRDDQLSNWFVMNEIEQQRTMATILPFIFILVSVFLTNMVLSRLIATERTEIGLLKAFGYSRVQLIWHYTKMVLLICLIGWVIGAMLGAAFGRMNTVMYAEMFKFPLLIYRPSLSSLSLGGVVCVGAVMIGALSAVRQAATLPPAQAMTPPSPPVYKQSFSLFAALTKWMDQPTRIALRQIRRWPVRSLFTCAGIAMSGGLIIMNLQWTDSLDHLARVYFFEAQRQDVMIGMPESVNMATLHDVSNLPGVMRAEPMRMISVDFNHANVTHRGAISAVLPSNHLQPIYDDAQRTAIAVPEFGLVISSRLAQKLKVNKGDILNVDVLEGSRQQLTLPVVALFETYIGMPAFINIHSLNALMKESPRFEYANLLIDKTQQDALFSALKSTPKISSVMLRQTAYEAFQSAIIEHLMVFISMFVLLASTLAFGVVYNSTRIALSERARELATLRVLGFSKGEISYILLGEVMFLVLVGLPLGCLAGWLLVVSMATAFDTEMFRVPLYIETSTYGLATALVILAATISAAIVRRRVDSLDLIKVLKTRD
ncbi:ABC transporter permease [Alteromonas facilis]|uniref:ABC transporter permease n=1 Tax=Alteromonas facilis TaxID=2048004 RepID=UPI000C2826A6|nr:ABC transporter permease [Alteromonas facilis]